MKEHVDIVDLFCGAGGTSTGILKAVSERLGKVPRLTAVNHWRTAVNTHALNHPTVKHLCESVENLHPLDLAPDGLHLLAASCECRFHSNARGGGPCNEQSRSQPWQLVRWATDISVENILMENVREFMKWGPLHRRTKRPIKSRRGEFFKAFINALMNLGYQVEFRIQKAADYGDPTSRERFIMIARKGKAVVWPEATHGPGRGKPWRAARGIIDWQLKGKSLFGEDGSPRLCANTVARIAAGLKKFGGAAAEPFLVLLRGTSKEQIERSARTLAEPLPTLTAGGGHMMLCEPFVIGQQSGAIARSTEEPLPTVATAGAIRLVQPFIVGAGGPARAGEPSSIEKPLHTVMCRNTKCLVEPLIVQTDQTGGNGCYSRPISAPFPTVVTKQNALLVQPLVVKYYKSGVCKPVDEPLDTVTTKARFMLVECESGKAIGEMDILTRMFEPYELAAAHSFPKHYQFTGNKAARTKQIGNSVPVELACAHAEAALS